MIKTLGIAVIAIIWAIILLPVFFNRLLPKWACRIFGWHIQPKKINFNGCSLNGACPRCGKHVLLDSQGNWF